MPLHDPAPFDDVAASSAFSVVEKLCLRWRMARRGEELPYFEDVGLGSLGSLADDLALAEPRQSGGFIVLRAGIEVAKLLGRSLPGVAIQDLDANYRDAFTNGLSRALLERRPTLALARSVCDGLVATCEIIALPLSNRWGGELVLIFVKQRPEARNLVDAIYRATTDGLLALAALRTAGGRQEYQIVSLNAGAASQFGRSEGEIRWKLLSDFIAPTLAGELYLKLDEALASQAASEFEFCYLKPKADPAYFRVSVAPIGDVLGITFTNISEIKLREESVKLLFESNPIPLLVYDRETLRITRVNDAMVRQYGYPRERLLGMALCDLHGPDERGRAAASARRRSDRDEAGGLWRHTTADGRLIDVTVYSRELPQDGRASILASVLDVTEQRQAEARVIFMAHHDHLTSLPNRVLFKLRLDDALSESARRGTRIAVHCIDLDFFKTVNDTLGHSIGDAVLQTAAERIRAAVREDDVVARLGGDEFAVIQFGAQQTDDVSRLAARVIETVSAPYPIAGQQVTLGASIGIALAPEDAVEREAILKNADVALYRAKADGKGVYRFFESGMDAQLRARRQLEIDLRGALEAGEFTLHYQPLISAATETVIGCEALLRWRHPERGFVPPAEFIPIAEEIGLIATLGDWVLKQACEEAATWPDHLSIAVNLSPVQVRGSGLAASVAMALGASGLAPSRLELEITESVLLFESDANRAVLEQLQALGVSISIDDFGTGYSSLSYLRSFPIDKIKIDRSFVRDLEDNAGCLAIIRAVVTLGQSLGITTLAEGVETRSQFDRLTAEGCTQVQGYLFSPPLPAEQFRARFIPTRAVAVAA